MYKALYRAYRPETFEDVLGQEHIVRILKNQIANDSVAHAYLFCGIRGTGKTTMARLLAKGVNCKQDGAPCGKCEDCNAIKSGTYLDVIEIDAASNNGVDNIRDLRESVNYPPVLGRKKVYIIDEVHMLSHGAFNALLKTLEEPPQDVIFVLATTEPQKLPATIMSRCLTLDFRRISEKQLVSGMKKICEDLNIDVSDEALAVVARNADGSVRDALSILDQCIAASMGKISYEDVLDVLGTVGDSALIEMADLVIAQKPAEAIEFLDKLIDEGREVKELAKEFLRHARNVLVCKYVAKPQDMLGVSAENAQRIKKQADKLSILRLHQTIDILSKTLNDIKWASQPRVLLELALVQLAEPTENKVQEESKKTAKAETKLTTNLKVEKSKETIPKVPESKEPANNDRLDSVKNMDKTDYDSIWSKVCKDGASENATFNFLANSAELWEFTDTHFVIAALNPVTQKTLETVRDKIEAGVEKYAGINLPMLCKLKAVLETESAGKKNIDAQKTKEELEKKLNLGIEIV
ncbi:MAG: DNA polymerase III subunit gamma/tau [Eubacteriales bacterium]